MRLRTLVIGLDGADMAYMQPWLAAGRLPNIARLLEDGASFPFMSLHTDHTSVAWPAFYTGKNPGKTSMTDAVLLDARTGELVPSNIGRGLKTQPYWEYAAEHDLRTLLVNAPMLFPLRPVSGWVVGGFDTPPGSEQFAWPDSLHNMLEEKGYREDVLSLQHRITLLSRGVKSGFPPDQYLQLCEQLTENLLSYTTMLMQADEWDSVFVGYQLTDLVNHYTSDDDVRGSVYEMADRLVGSLLDLVSDDWLVVVASDHGSQTHQKHISMSQLLVDTGLLHFHSVISSVVVSWLAALVLPGTRFNHWLQDTAASVWKALPLWMRKVISWPLLQVVPGWSHYYQTIDWSQTKAYLQSSMKTIYINRTDRHPRGIVQPGLDYESVRDEVIAKLEAVRDPDTGEQLFNLHRVEDLWHGPWIDETAPDLIYTLKNESAYILQADARGRKIWLAAEDEATGTHRREGILLMQGPGVKAGFCGEPVSIMDAAPSLLYIHQVPIPLEIDGSVLRQAFTAQWLEAHPPQKAQHARPVELDPPAEPGYSEEDKAAVLEKLRALGYIE